MASQIDPVSSKQEISRGGEGDEVAALLILHLILVFIAIVAKPRKVRLLKGKKWK